MSALILQYTIVNNELCDALLTFLKFSTFLVFLCTHLPLGQEKRYEQRGQTCCAGVHADGL